MFVPVESAFRMHCDLSKRSDVDLRAYQGTTSVVPPSFYISCSRVAQGGGTGFSLWFPSLRPGIGTTSVVLKDDARFNAINLETAVKR
jgi:hypothetical protein